MAACRVLICCRAVLPVTPVQATGNQPLSEVKEGAAAFGSGLMHGLMGIVLDPIKGAQSDGVAGFFQGVGRGLVGVVVKPTVGVLDMAASALNAVSHIDHLGSIKPGSLRSRPPRFFAANGVLHTYNRREANGGVILFMVQLHDVACNAVTI